MTNDNRFVVTKEKLKLAQNKMLDMLLCFQKFCKEYQLQFYLHGGAAIGAVRVQHSKWVLVSDILSVNF